VGPEFTDPEINVARQGPDFIFMQRGFSVELNANPIELDTLPVAEANPQGVGMNHR
jgi:hypothetical protein